jgi:flavin-dependent dehydrogenase
MYDTIVVGARCAGSPTAMLLARQGYRVLLVDKAQFPSDILSTHYIRLPGIARLKRWGVLDQVLASRCPPITRVIRDLGPFALSGMAPPLEGATAIYAPRRTILDKILVDAAVEAGAELREGFLVQELLMDGDRVTGIRGHSAGGRSVEERAHIVIGADGMRSFVARTVHAPTYRETPSLTCIYYSYWSGVPLEEVVICTRPDRFFIAFPTNEPLVCIVVEWPVAEFHHFRADLEGHFLQTLDFVPDLGERVRQGKREERFSGTADLPNFFRKPFGAGWALVGDAGYHKDPNLAYGITDAFRDAELLAEAIDAGLTGRQSLEEALGGYEQRRNASAIPFYELNLQLASLQPSSPERMHLLAALRGNQEQINRFFGVVEGTVPFAEFYAPENLRQILAAAGEE